MFHALVWLAVLILFGLWSLAAWAFQAVAAWTMSAAGTWAGGAGATEALRLPPALGDWMPPAVVDMLTGVMQAMLPAVQSLVAAAPALTGALSIGVWVIWALGSALLVLMGLGFSGLIAVLRRRARPQVQRMPANAPR